MEKEILLKLLKADFAGVVVFLKMALVSCCGVFQSEQKFMQNPVKTENESRQRQQRKGKMLGDALQLCINIHGID